MGVRTVVMKSLYIWRQLFDSSFCILYNYHSNLVIFVINYADNIAYTKANAYFCTRLDERHNYCPNFTANTELKVCIYMLSCRK